MYSSVRHSTRAVLAAAGVVMAIMIGIAVAPQASAATYRYWGYWQLKGTSWAFATKGPDQVKAADGSVEGWRWAVAGETDTRTPRGTVTFDQVCQATPAKAGTKRVAVVVDFGRPADAETGKPAAPHAECAQVPADATSAAVLAAVSTVRIDKGMTCGIDNWPAAGCGGEVKTVSAAAKAADDKATIAVPSSAKAAPTPAVDAAPQPAESEAASSNKGLVTTLAAAAVVLLALAGLLLTLRRRRATEVG